MESPQLHFSRAFCLYPPLWASFIIRLEQGSYRSPRHPIHTTFSWPELSHMPNLEPITLKRNVFPLDQCIWNPVDTQITWGSCKIVSDSVGLGWGLRADVSQKLPGGADSAGWHTTKPWALRVPTQQLEVLSPAPEARWLKAHRGLLGRRAKEWLTHACEDCIRGICSQW